MRLYKQIVTRTLAENDEARNNQEFPIYNIYANIQLCATILGTRLPDSERTNELHQKYLKARLQGDNQKIKHYIQELKTQTIKDTIYIHTFLEQTKNLDIEDNTRTEAYHTDSVGLLAHEDI